ncbi:uncharacterized protein PHALS_07804 [Plasmopara halstedii]|uniref:Uncharacterized protein n=1 Tax=Plasmopara halstedii TaxID=4781 RepID=A0A0P1B8E2_PLAHL|nr:uncharacterized protein PHALS_07804 [Plasmopara halstedii]CEG50077.1 hypothetical protein PHALS_07804 [Plasmopara halstedii]|eukprot:XP_024586446.1 hypothetical protein PHALS_07804 [Plasmopara halstedii]
MVGDISCRSVASEPKKWKACQQKMAVVVTERLREHIAIKVCANASSSLLSSKIADLRSLPDEAFEHMMAMFEPPDGIRNFWEVNTFEVNNKKKDLQRRDRLKTRLNLLHRVGLQIRR